VAHIERSLYRNRTLAAADWKREAGELVATLVFMLSPSSSVFENVTRREIANRARAAIHVHFKAVVRTDACENQCVEFQSELLASGALAG